MDVTRQQLIDHFRNIGDDELLERASSGELTSLAQSVADDEIRVRGLRRASAEEISKTGDSIAERDWVPVTSFMYVKDADVIEEILRQEGIPVKQASPNDQKYAAFAPELATSQVLVPKQLLVKAKATLEAKERAAEN